MGVFKRARNKAGGKVTNYYYIRYMLSGKMKWESVGEVGKVTKSVCEALLAERKKQIKLGQLDEIRVDIPTLPNFAKEYLHYVTDVKKKRSWKKDEVTLRHMIDFFGNKKLSQISPKDLDDYKLNMLNNGYKPASVNRELACLKYLYNLAIRRKCFFSTNPVSEVEYLDEGEGITRILTHEEEKRLISNSPPLLASIIFIALNTAMRKMEILSLKWDYIDLEKNFITLPQTNTKAKKTRVVPINSIIRTILLELKLKSQGSLFVFPSADSINGHVSWIKHSFGSSCKRAKIQNLRFHDLRHTCATRMIEAGADIVSVSKILGHSDINLTVKRYLHPEDSLKFAVEKLAISNPNCSQNYSQANSMKKGVNVSS